MRDGLVLQTAEGLLGGALGTLVVKRGLPSGGERATTKTSPRPDPWGELITRIEGYRERPLPPHVHERLAKVPEWAYGATWGGLLGLSVHALHERRPSRTLLAGAAMGAVVWAVEAVGFLPSLGLAPPVTRRKPEDLVMSFGKLVLFGVVAAAPIAAYAAREQRTERRLRRSATKLLRGLGQWTTR